MQKFPQKQNGTGQAGSVGFDGRTYDPEYFIQRYHFVVIQRYHFVVIRSRLRWRPQFSRKFLVGPMKNSP